MAMVKGAGGRLAQCGLGATLFVAMASAATPATHADPPALHRVTYTVSAERSAAADIYFRDADPASWAEYSHNPYQFSPKVEANVGPSARWTRDVWLATPDQWAMVSATSGLAPVTPNFHCELAVDGAVVATNNGAKGALCSLRHW
ncbi:hypothetical protein MAAFP003_3620 [Mycobacterium ahvazicum]|uniref:Secreted protein n=2 Tax=Mycobacterium ahvazicum TaxID=1964395 RepID=A0A2K4YDT5_9MYCO|nr:hypothetical protein MAAFP003_3620 [Mycobacterium ahvazicum]